MLFYSWKIRTQVVHGLQRSFLCVQKLDAGMALGSKMAGRIGVKQALLAWLQLLLLAFQLLNYNWKLPQLNAAQPRFGPCSPVACHRAGASLAFGFRLGCPMSGMRAVQKRKSISTWWGAFGLFCRAQAQAWLKNINVSQCLLGKCSTYSDTQDWLQGYSMDVESLQRFPKINKARPWVCRLSWGAKHRAGLQRLSKFWVLSRIKGTMLCQILKDYEIIRDIREARKWNDWHASIACGPLLGGLYLMSWRIMSHQCPSLFLLLSLHFWHVGRFHSSEACQWLNDSGKGGDKVPVDAFSIDCRPYQPGTWTETELFDRPLEQNEL